MNRVPLISLAFSLMISGAAAADEGMWTFDRVPVAAVKAAHGVDISPAWLSRVSAASVRIPGCSASVVSRDGLVLTNNHCVRTCLVALSTPAADHLQDGFLTAVREDEKTCPGMTAEVLVSSRDVTAEIQAATAGKTGEAFVGARETAMVAAESEACRDIAESRCQTVSLHRGGRFVVYRYHRYDDVRMVFAPEFSAAFFGGDPDNFNFPRYGMDAAFLRLYAQGRPARTPAFLPWSVKSPVAGEATFISGNPGSTERQLTVSQLQALRDVSLPAALVQLAELRGRLVEYSRRDEAAQRRAADALFTTENSFKVYSGRQMSLTDPAFMEAKRQAEAELRARVAADPALAAAIGDPWAEIATAQQAYARDYMTFRQLETDAGRGSKLFSWARTIVRAAQARTESAEDRLPEFADSRLPAQARRLTAAVPVDTDLERLYLEFWLLKTREALGADPAVLDIVLGRESPDALADRLVAGSRLADPAVRQALWDGGLAAVQASDDPMIRYVLSIEVAARATRKVWGITVTDPTSEAAERIARARFAVYGDTAYPDATFTLRLSYGKVAGWSWRGRDTGPFTTFGGLYARATGAAPYALAPRWIAARARLDPDTVYDFTTTNDIIGGNSGSPVINARGEVIGTVFDGNIHSLAGAYGYDGAVNRAVVVSTAAITEALRKVYGRDALVKELLGR
ncbi:MAG: S46 family peptidase [Caulobacter sp.]|nr:S46 family peptidase [Caulobacter sp.]